MIAASYDNALGLVLGFAVLALLAAALIWPERF